MTKVNLHLLNIFALKVKKSSVEYEGSTVGDIITQFVREYKDMLDAELLSKNRKKLNKFILVLVNGRSIEYLKKYKTKLNAGDELFISIPLSGG